VKLSKYFFLSHNIYFPYSTHSASDSDFIFLYHKRYFLCIFSLDFVTCFQMPEIALAIYVSLHVMCVLLLSSINRKINISTIFHKIENAQYEIPYVYLSDHSDYKKDSTKPYGSFSQFICKRA